jgi:hypothetical protein
MNTPAHKVGYPHYLGVCPNGDSTRATPSLAAKYVRLLCQLDGAGYTVSLTAHSSSKPQLADTTTFSSDVILAILELMQQLRDPGAWLGLIGISLALAGAPDQCRGNG